MSVTVPIGAPSGPVRFAEALTPMAAGAESPPQAASAASSATTASKFKSNFMIGKLSTLVGYLRLQFPCYGPMSVTWK